ncbi:MAG: transporter substrate-binding domain-containing protein [Burkholderiales bacterium]|nr:transporter substrate-binding domain-containing protein [Burkholderiales bacterium]
MRQFFLRPVFWLAAILCTAVSAAPVLSIVAPDYWCPFSCHETDAQPGFTIEIVRAIFEPLGYRVDFHNENYARALVDVRAGRFDVIPSAIRAEAPDFVFPKEAVSVNRFCVYTPIASGWPYHSPADFGARRIGVIKGYDYGPRIDAWLQSKTQHAEVHSGDDIVPRMISKLEMGRLDAFIEEEHLVDWSLFKMSHPGLRKAGCETPIPGYLGFSPTRLDAKQMAQTYDAGIVRLRKSGQLSHIMASYGLAAW